MPRKTLKGTVKSITGPKTIGVEVVRTFHHPQYRKRVRRTKRYLAHFEGDAFVGMGVVIRESTPISKRKRWTVIEAGGKPILTENDEKEEKKTVRKPAEEKSPAKKARRVAK